MRRRDFLMSTSAVACPLCVGLASHRAFGSEESPHWSYSGDEGPGHWGSLSPDYAACSGGAEQSPIDLAGAIQAEIAPADIAWRAMSQYGVVNNGHTIQVNVPEGNRTTVLGKDYAMLQFHFHHASEHTMDGQHFPLEAHFVHRAADGSLSVIGVLFAQGAENAALSTVWSVMPTAPGDVNVDGRPVDPIGMLPEARSAYLYYGSLTTPPCSEVVTWVVMSTPITASAGQIAEFDAVYRANYRPVQPLNRRLLLLGG